MGDNKTDGAIGQAVIGGLTFGPTGDGTGGYLLLDHVSGDAVELTPDEVVELHLHLVYLTKIDPALAAALAAMLETMDLDPDPDQEVQ